MNTRHSFFLIILSEIILSEIILSENIHPKRNGNGMKRRQTEDASPRLTDDEEDEVMMHTDVPTLSSGKELITA